MVFTSFEDVVQEHSRSLRAFARTQTSDPWLADEAVHVTFIRAWEHAGSFRGEGSYEGWLVRICRNVIADLAKKSSRHVSIAEAEVLQCSVLEDASLLSVELESSLAEVPDALRGALVLCGLLGYDYESAATLLDVPVGTVRSRVHRGRSALRSALDTRYLQAA